ESARRMHHCERAETAKRPEPASVPASGLAGRARRLALLARRAHRVGSRLHTGLGLLETALDVLDGLAGGDTGCLCRIFDLFPRDVAGVPVVVVRFTASTVGTHRRALLRASNGCIAADADAWRSVGRGTADGMPTDRRHVVEVRQSV